MGDLRGLAVMERRIVPPLNRRRGAPLQVQAPGPRPTPVSPPGTVACKACGHRFVAERYEQALRVCPHCGHHGSVSASVRAAQLADPGTLELLDLSDVPERDPLEFNDGVPYTERIAQARSKTGISETFVVGKASIEGSPVVLACMDFAFLGGSLGSAAGECFARGADAAVAERRALVAVCTSGGARMQEGIASLAQMARCTAGVSRVGAAGLPYITILADPCYGGVTASFAVQGDAVLSEPKARIGFAGGRVIEQASHDKLPEGFQTAEFLVQHGMIDAVVPRPELRAQLGKLLRAYMRAA